jgi:hypothetical protein
MLAREEAPNQLCRRIPLAIIDQVVTARLGQTRVPCNAQPAAFNRQIAMYLAKHLGGWSTTRIGTFNNGPDHSTVCYALKRVAALREDDPEVDGLVSSLAADIKTAESTESCRTNSENQTLADVEDLPFNEAFLGALVDRVVARILDKAKGLDAKGIFGPE